MNKAFVKPLLFGFLFVLCSFSVHKFYVSIYQITFNSTQKRVEVTARLFVDDLNLVLEQKFQKKTHLELLKPSVEELNLLQNYIDSTVIITINGTQKNMQFISSELENNVLICYFKINNISKVTSFAIKNEAFMEQFSSQQNIIQTNINGKKNSLLLTSDSPKGTIEP